MHNLLRIQLIIQEFTEVYLAISKKPLVHFRFKKK